MFEEISKSFCIDVLRRFLKGYLEVCSEGYLEGFLQGYPQAYLEGNLECFLSFEYELGDDENPEDMDFSDEAIEQFESYHNYSGCGNTLNCNAEATANLILDSLRYFVLEYHIAIKFVNQNVNK